MTRFLLILLLLYGCTLQHIKTPAAEVTILTPAQARVEVPIEAMTCTAPPNATYAGSEVVTDTTQAANVWIQIGAMAVAFFSLVSAAGWP